MSANAFPGTVVFDLDGTLIDTAADLTRALNFVLALKGRPPVAVADVRDMIGRGAKRMIERGMAKTGAPLDDDAELDRLFDIFIEFYRENIAVESGFFPGAPDVLARLADAGSRLAICTNKTAAMSEMLIDRLGASALFGANLGADSLAERKPSPLHLLKTVERAGGDPADAVMIGDAETDFKAARAAAIPIVLVRFGYSEIPVETLDADAHITHFAELPDILSRLVKR